MRNARVRGWGSFLPAFFSLDRLHNHPSEDDEEEGEYECVRGRRSRVTTRACLAEEHARAPLRSRSRSPSTPKGKPAAPAFGPATAPTSLSDLALHFSVTDVRGGG